MEIHLFYVSWNLFATVCFNFGLKRFHMDIMLDFCIAINRFFSF